MTIPEFNEKEVKKKNENYTNKRLFNNQQWKERYKISIY